MLKPSDGIKGVEEFVLETVEKGAPNACAPIIVGVGVGGTFEKAALLAKEALSRPIGVRNARQHIQGLEEILIERCNNLGIGPMYYVAQKPELFEVTSEVLTNEPIAVTVRKGEDAFTEKLNETLKKLQENGTMTEISMKWFGEDMTNNINSEIKVIE